MPFVNHVEFEVTNLKRAAKFYKAVLGLRIRIIPQMKYALWSAGRKPGGGFSLVKKKRVKHGGTTAVFQVDNIDRYLKKARKNGSEEDRDSPRDGILRDLQRPFWEHSRPLE